MNLIITCARHREADARQEISGFLEEFGDDSFSITITKMSGVLTADTSLDPVSIIDMMREKIYDEPWSVRYCLRVIPIQIATGAGMQEIIDAASGLQIQDAESYRITVEKRDSDLSSKELITGIAGNIKNKVSLEHPDKIVLVEILQDKAGISLLNSSDILSIQKTKRNMP